MYDKPMEQNKPGKKQPKKTETREDRLKAALKANMAKRKAQARARAAGDGEPQNKGQG